MRLAMKRYNVRLTSLFYLILFLIVYFYLYEHLTIYRSSNQDHAKILLQRKATPFKVQIDLDQNERSLYQPSSCLMFIKNIHKSLSNNLKEVKFLLESLRFTIKLVELDRFPIESLLKVSKKYSFIVFESWDLFNSLTRTDQAKLTNYCEQFQIGLLIFNIGIQKSNSSHRINELKECDLNTLFLQNHTIKLNLTKVPDKPVSFKSKIDFSINDLLKLNFNSYNSLVKCELNKDLIFNFQNKPNLRHILFNIDLSIGFPLVTTLFIDLLAYLTYGRFWMSTKRFIQIDIDDIFVGQTGRRMKPDDVFELKNFQENYLNRKIFTSSKRKFKFNLGFSGHFYQSGNTQENEADKLLLQQKDRFNWFDHGWSHLQPHLMNTSLLKQHMLLNYEFAINNSLQVDSMYAVTPHHSGVYPIYDDFLDIWKETWNIKATSTETYPHLKPYHLRRGYVHNEIMVLPRQACGIYTHTIYLKDYPNGLDKLISMINGGELFKALLTNQVLIYMTHMTNYGSDRIALFLFRKLFDYLNEWTNIDLHSLEPFEMAKKYFELYPSEIDPLWTNPCDDKSHLKIWSLKSTDYCQRVPQFLIIGPQKTGTTALHKYLSIHPQLKTNKMTSEFEETQFFSKNYYFGIDWYLSLFENENNSSIMFYEKSATYFTDPLAPIRIKSIKKDMKLVFITIDPVDRAYSWYQHMKHHNDEIAKKYSFHDVITLNHSNREILNGMQRLRKKCLDPGIYHKHLVRWLSHFRSDQLFIVDGSLLKSNPPKILSNLQKSLQFSEIIDYRDYLAYDKRKGFFCLINKKSQKKCLGSSKGRKYEKMESRTRDFLENYYLNYNKKLLNLLKINAFDIPIWLKTL